MADPRDLPDPGPKAGAVEWEQAAANADGPPAAETGLLEQDEIDSLLGVSQGTASRRSGLEALVDNNIVSYERLPMLEVVFDRLVRILTTSLRNFTSENVELTLESITSLRFGDYLQGVPVPVMIAVFRAVQWDNYGLLTIGHQLIYTVVEVLLGGRRGGPPAGRRGPTVHQHRARPDRAPDPLGAGRHGGRLRAAQRHRVSLRAARDQSPLRRHRPTDQRRRAVQLRIEMDDRGSPLEILIPYATLEPVRDLLLQMFMGEKFGRDSIWETHLARRCW